MNNLKVIKVAMIDDHHMLRIGFCQLLEKFGIEITFEAENGALALKKLEEGAAVPDICVVDINMPVMNGVELTKVLTKRYPAMKIMAFSINDDKKDVTQMLECGADGYILKGADPDEIKKAIEVVFAGGRYFSTGIAQIAQEYFTNK